MPPGQQRAEADRERRENIRTCFICFNVVIAFLSAGFLVAGVITFVEPKHVASTFGTDTSKASKLDQKTREDFQIYEVQINELVFYHKTGIALTTIAASLVILVFLGCFQWLDRCNVKCWRVANRNEHPRREVDPQNENVEPQAGQHQRADDDSSDDDSDVGGTANEQQRWTTRRNYLLIAYLVILLVVWIGQCIALIMVLNWYAEIPERIKDMFENFTIKENYDGRNGYSQTVNLLHFVYECCGIFGQSDFQDITKLPPSCCKPEIID
ncbi:hypothetical protein BaRGS_00035050, partial [Batillaria attramentaria]